MEKMGYRNAGAVYELSRAGKLLKPRGGKITVHTMAELVLIDMALSSYDWDSEHKEPSRDAKAKGYPCRYYTKGWKTLAEDHGMMALSPEQVIGKSEEEVEAAMKAREGTAKARIIQAWKFLRDQGLIKCLQPATLGKNAGYLLLLGDDEENRAVERWARQCLGLPMIW